MNQALGIPLIAFFLALSSPLAKGSGAEALVQEPQKRIEEKSAGLHLRQPDKERAWLNELSGTFEPSPETAKKAADKAIAGARQQEPLVKTFEENIWAKVQSEFKRSELNYDEKYLEKLVQQNREDGIYEATHLYIFISKSVPAVTLRNYQRALEGIPTAFVLRGPIGDDPSRFAPTQEWVQRFICGEPPYEAGSKCFLNPVDISPNLYRIFGIESVPAMVYVPNPTLIASCGMSPMEEHGYFVWYGDLAPAYVLEQIQKLRPDDQILSDILRRVGR